MMFKILPFLLLFSGNRTKGHCPGLLIFPVLIGEDNKKQMRDGRKHSDKMLIIIVIKKQYQYMLKCKFLMLVDIGNIVRPIEYWKLLGKKKLVRCLNFLSCL